MNKLSCPMECGVLVPRPGIEPASPALAGRFLTAGPPGKSLFWSFLILIKFKLVGALPIPLIGVKINTTFWETNINKDVLTA